MITGIMLYRKGFKIEPKNYTKTVAAKKEASLKKKGYLVKVIPSREDIGKFCVWKKKRAKMVKK